MKIGCVILAGGKSSRMGQDKAFLEMNGKKFIIQLTEEFSYFEEKIIARGNNQAIAGTDWRIIKDIYSERGPIGGIHAALSMCESDALFCITCDMPLIKQELFLLLFEFLDETCDAVISVTVDGRKHPLCGIYQKSVASIFEEQILQGNNRIMSAVERMRVKYVIVDFAKGAQQLLNVNTPIDYLELKKYNE